MIYYLIDLLCDYYDDDVQQNLFLLATVCDVTIFFGIRLVIVVAMLVENPLLTHRFLLLSGKAG